MKKYNAKKFYLSLLMFIGDFVLFIFFVLQAEKHSFFNILAFLFCLVLPILFIWSIICFVKMIVSYIKDKISTKQIKSFTNEENIKTIKTCKSCGCAFDNSNICPTCGKIFKGKNIIIKETQYSKNEDNCKKTFYFDETKQNIDEQDKKIDIEFYKNFYLQNSQNEHARIKRAKYECFTFVDFDEKNYKTTVVNAEQTKKYKTTIKNCTCGDFKDRKLPCKHMYRFADYCSIFQIYKDGERDVVNKLMVLWRYRNLIPYLIDIFYRITEKKNKYYKKITPNIKKLAELNLIILNDIPPYDFIDWQYNANELKGLLYEKEFKKTISKKELVELFISDEKLLKKLPKNIKHITLNFDEKVKDEVIECLNYMNYHE